MKCQTRVSDFVSIMAYLQREKMKRFYPEGRDPMSMISIVTDTAGGERPCS